MNSKEECVKRKTMSEHEFPASGTFVRGVFVLLMVLAWCAFAPGVRAQAPCCSITAIDTRTATVSAKVNATGAPFQFKVPEAKMLSGLKIGQVVYADFTAKRASLDGKSACCVIIDLPHLIGPA